MESKPSETESKSDKTTGLSLLVVIASRVCCERARRASPRTFSLLAKGGLDDLRKAMSAGCRAAEACVASTSDWNSFALASSAIVEHSLTCPLSKCAASSPCGLCARLSALSNNIWLQFQQLPSLLNTITGFDSVEHLKSRVNEKDLELKEKKLKLDQVKQEFEQIIDARRVCQMEMNSLLQRKHSWVEGDADRLGELHRRELSLEQAEKKSKIDNLTAAEAFDRCHVEYLSEIRERYIEEQLFSDKIRKASTFWTWGLIGLQIVIFIVLTFIVEPYKRRRFERELTEILHQTSIKNAQQAAETIEKVIALVSQKETETIRDSKPAVEESDIDRKGWKSVKSLLIGTGFGVGVLLTTAAALLVSYLK
ncbi:sensitivity to high expression protein she9 [Nowakowskiella sp. JEL0407]|nr:sensitivity to high expression protein she9 [Nowakowskiella sp. JEL0407]